MNLIKVPFLHVLMVLLLGLGSMGAYADEAEAGRGHFANKKMRHDKKGKAASPAMSDYHKESIELRRQSVEETRSKHLELLNKMYDLNIAHLNDLEELGKKIEAATDKVEKEKLLEELKQLVIRQKEISKNYYSSNIKPVLGEIRKSFYSKMKQRRDEARKKREAVQDSAKATN